MKKLALGALVGLLLCSTTAFGQGLEQKVQDLQKTVADQQQLIADLMQRMDDREELGTSWAAGGEKSEWYHNWKFSGDFRYRHEYSDDDADDDSRHRQRMRFRLNGSAKVNDEVTFNFQLSTSSSTTSGNTTFDNAWSGKGIYIRRAEFEYKPAAAEGLVIRGGKLKQPFHTPQKSEVQWDHDIAPEGGLIGWSGEVSDGFDLMAQVGGWWVEERSMDVDSGLISGELAGKYKFDAWDGAYVFGGFGCFRYIHPSIGGALLDTDVIDVHVYQGFVEVGGQFEELPWSAYFHYCHNTAAEDFDDENQAWAIGLKLGKADAPGTWQASYIYKVVELAAVHPDFTDSDFGGGGGNASGHEFAAKVAVMENWKIGASLFINEYNIADDDLDGADDEDWTLFQLDLLFSF